MVARVQKKFVEFRGTGRRKGTASARVFLRPGNGELTINGCPLKQYFPVGQLQAIVNMPFKIANLENRFDTLITVTGGGFSGQAEAIRLAIARALKEYELSSFSEPATPSEAGQFDNSLLPIKKSLRKARLLRADSRKKERKKYGLHGARKGTQFSKR